LPKQRSKKTQPIFPSPHARGLGSLFLLNIARAKPDQFCSSLSLVVQRNTADFRACRQAGMRIFSSLNLHAANPDNYRDGSQNCTYSYTLDRITSLPALPTGRQAAGRQVSDTTKDEGD